MRIVRKLRNNRALAAKNSQNSQNSQSKKLIKQNQFIINEPQGSQY